MNPSSTGDQRHSSVPYIAPFALFLALLALQNVLPIPQRIEFGARFFIMGGAIWYFSRSVLDFRVRQPLLTVAVGIAVFLIWIGPDALIPGYRSHWLFTNGITGAPKGSVESSARNDHLLLAFRTLRAVIIVPIVEELFWRAWLMRWVVDRDFWKIPLGFYQRSAFLIVAALFASEHGPYWEVGLVAGIIYNWWMVRTKSLGDLIAAHAITNGLLCAYVLATNKWEYWL